MSRRVTIDCRQSPKSEGCQLAISGTEQEVLETALWHAAAKHGCKDSPEFRAQLRAMLKEEAYSG